MGYSRARFEVVGVDIAPQKHYPFEFHQADALEYLAEHGREFDVVHASPPCQRYSQATPREHRSAHPDLIAPTRASLRKCGKPYVIENVRGAPLRGNLVICGCQVGLLSLRRARYFEIWPAISISLPPHQHDHEFFTVVGQGTNRGELQRLGRSPRIAEKRRAMGIDWMNRNELAQAIPPAYTEAIGKQLFKVL